MKLNKKILLTIGIILLFVIIFKDTNSNIISINYYDENKNLINPTLSVVQGTPLVKYIDITVTATNTGTEPLTCSVVSATPNIFSNSLDTSMKNVPIEPPKKVSWTTSLIDVMQLEGLNQPVRFEATLRCSYTRGTETTYLPDKAGYVDLNIFSDLNYLIVDSPITLGGEHSYYAIIVNPTGVINVDPSIGWLNLTAERDIVIEGKIDSTGMIKGGSGADAYSHYGAYSGQSGSGLNPGSGGIASEGDKYTLPSATGGGGASISGTKNGFDVYSGSGGGGGGAYANYGVWSWGGGGGAGAGWISLNAPTITLSGILDASGGSGTMGRGDNNAVWVAGGGGGGSGATILLNGGTIYITGNIDVSGGVGNIGNRWGTTQQPGNGVSGSGGRIKVFYKNTYTQSGSTINYGSGSYYSEQS